MATLLKEVRLIMADNGTDADTGKQSNHYKYWNAKLYDDGMVRADWGRVGGTGDSGEWSGGQSYLDKKVREKIKKGYTEQKTIGEVTVNVGTGSTVKNADLHSIAKSQLIKSSNPTLERLITRFVQANVHKITSSTQITYNSTSGLFTTPLGIVEKSGLDEARILLAEISPYVRQHNFGTQSDAILCKYLRIIPQSLGMKRFSTETLIPDDNALQRQLDLIDSLESSYQATQSDPATPNKPNTPQDQIFKVDLDVLANQTERSRLDRYFETSKKRMHGYDNIHVKEIYSLNIHNMTDNFLSTDKNIVEVFHGSSMANALSILKVGLKISPPSTAAIAGALFGRGLYGAINSSKSLGYCLNRWGQGGVGDAAFLFICSFAMGHTYETKTYGCTRPSGYDSIWAKASPGGLNNDELIVGTENRCKINYLLECK